MWMLAHPWMGTIDELMVLEEWFGISDPKELGNRYETALAALESDDVNAWLEVGRNAGITHGAERHFKDDWLDGAMVPGVDRDTIQSALQSGFGAALSDARDAGLPISVLWVMVADGADAFRVNHLVGKNAVTVVFSLPNGTVPDSAAAM